MSASSTTQEHSEASPLVRIRSLLPGLARAEQRVAKVVLDNPGSVARRSITEVADAAGTSETTVTRFCKAIGVGGYPELRIALAADTARTEMRTDRDLGGDISPTDNLKVHLDEGTTKTVKVEVRNAFSNALETPVVKWIFPPNAVKEVTVTRPKVEKPVKLELGER